MATAGYAFEEDDVAIEEGTGHPRAYAKLCRDRCGVGVYTHGPPFSFTPFPLDQHEASRAKQLEQLFPVIDPKAKPTTKPKIFVSLLWKHLNHLGNAGFDPAVIRVDLYGNVLYFHADKASPLAWDIDHWFPCSRGGLTVPSNLRILQWQVCKRKHNKLEFLVPWWDLQLGISVNQFLSIFASSNSDFRRRAFSYLFSEAENEEIHDSQPVESHSFPQHFIESKEQLGLAPAAIVLSRRVQYDSSLALRSLDYNRQMRSHSPAICNAARHGMPGDLKENENPDFATNPYQAIVMARDSLMQKEAQKMQAEIQKLDDEVHGLSRKNDEEKLSIQDLELQLIKRRRRAEKCRRLAEAQTSYRTMLEKMIRDAMHQSVVYKEQVRLNQAATSALGARLEAQKAICDASEKELHKKFKKRDELQAQINREWEQGRKRSRMDDTMFEDRDNKPVLYLPGIRHKTSPHKELRTFLEEEQRASETGLSGNEEGKHEATEEESKIAAKDFLEEDPCEPNKSAIVEVVENEIPIEQKLQELETGEEKRYKLEFPAIRKPEIEDEDEESRKERGKGNVERWLRMLLENSQEDAGPEIFNDHGKNDKDDMLAILNDKLPQKEVKGSTRPVFDKEEMTQVHKEEKQDERVRRKANGKVVEDIVAIEESKTVVEKGNISKLSGQGIGSQRFEVKERKDNRKERGLIRSESARTLRRIPSSPLILGMKKGMECMIKKPTVIGDDDCDENHAAGNSFIKSSFKPLRKH